MQKIVFILIAMIVNYIATGKTNYFSEREESFGCQPENAKAETHISNEITVFSQDWAGLLPSSLQSESGERCHRIVGLTDTDRSN